MSRAYAKGGGRIIERVWAKMSDVSERSNEVRAEKPFLF